MFREFSKLQVHRHQNHQGILEGDQGLLMLLMDTTQLTTSHHCRPMLGVHNAYYSLHIILNIEKMRTEWTQVEVLQTKYLSGTITSIYSSVGSSATPWSTSTSNIPLRCRPGYYVTSFDSYPLSLSPGQYISWLHWKVSLCRNILGNSRISDHFCKQTSHSGPNSGHFPGIWTTVRSLL